MKKLADIQFGPYAPDTPDVTNPGLEVANDVLPRMMGYDSLPQTLDYGATGLPSKALGAFSAKDADGNSYIFAGTALALHQLQNLAWGDVSRVSPAYNTATRWDFDKWDDLILAADGDNKPQALTLGTANFVDMTATNVQGAAIAVIRRFTVLGDVTDDDGHNPWRVRWGPVGDPTGDWTPDPTTQAGFRDLSTKGGAILRITGGEFGMVLRERSIYRMSIVGDANIVWRFDEVDPNIGAIAAGSVVQHGNKVFFWSEDGIRMTEGAASRVLGEERVDLTVLAELDQTYVNNITGAVFTDEQVVMWAYPGTGCENGSPNKLLMYNYANNRFATGDECVDVLFRASAPARSIDDFDDDPTFGGTQTPPLYASIDDIPGSLDDGVWSGGKFQLGAIGPKYQLGFFNGPPRHGEFESGERQFTPGRRTFVSEMRSVSNNASGISVQIGHRNSQKDPVVWTDPATPTAEGFIPARVDNRYMRFRVELQGGFEDAVGLEVYGESSGGR